MDTIQKGVPLAARGGITTAFAGKYGAIPVALKETLHSVDSLLNEVAPIMELKHPNVVQMYGIWKDSKERVFMVILTIVTPCCRHRHHQHWHGSYYYYTVDRFCYVLVLFLLNSPFHCPIGTRFWIFA